MQKLIDELNVDHDLIIKKMDEIYSLLSVKNFEETFPNLLEIILFFETFAFKEHHIREHKVLFQWMMDQNKNSDKSLINKIINDHKILEALMVNLRNGVEAFLNKTSSVPTSTIGSDLSYFVVKYREHLDQESKFIFAIASALSR